MIRREPSTQPPPSAPSGLFVAMAVGLLLVLGACSSDDGDDGPGPTAPLETTADTTTTSAPPTTTTEPRTPEEEVEEAYWRAEEVLDDLALSPDPGDPRLEETRIDPSLGHVRSHLQRLVDAEVAAEFPDGVPPDKEILEVAIDGDSAVVVSCRVDTSVAIDVSTGMVVDDTVVSALLETTLVSDGGIWKVSNLATTDEWPDGLGCER